MTRVRHKILGRLRQSVAMVVVLGVVATPVAVVTAPPLLAQAVFNVSSVAVNGNLRISDNTVRSIAGIGAGERVDPALINDATQRLYASGLFESVTITQNGRQLVVAVEERPTINRISIEGNKRLDDDVLIALVQSQSRQVFSATRAESDAQAILEAYAASGRIAAEVQPRVIKRSDNRVDLVFEVVEGRISEIEKVSFVGNRDFSDRRLRRVVATKQAGLFSTLFSSDTFVADRIEYDKQLLREFYLKRGYIDFDVLSATSEMTPERDAFLVNFKIQEGQQFRFGEVTVISDVAQIDPAAYAKENEIRAGDVYNPDYVDTLLERLEDRMSLDGYAFMRAVPRVTRNDDSQTLDIEIVLERGDRVFVERIDIEGNSTTLDRVIRRQFEIAEGDPFDRRAVQEATDRIRALDYFAEVDVSAREGSAPDQAVVDVNVTEKPTGNLAFGLSYSSDGGAAGQIELVERNFLGRGQTLRAAVSAGADNRNYQLAFTEPALFDRDLLAGINLHYQTSTSDSTVETFAFDTKTLTIEPRIGFPVSRNGRVELAYRLQQNEILNVSPSVSPLIQNDARKVTSSAIRASYTLDRRNSRIDPTGGFVLRFSQEFGGLGGDATYAKTGVNAKAYRSFFGDDLILSAELDAGYLANTSGGSRVTDRYFLGGDLFRGFQSLGMGPRDTVTGDALGGNIYSVAKFEASFPIGLPEEYGVYGGVFFDVGSLWSLDHTQLDGMSYAVDDSRRLRSSIGISIFWDTALGPLRFNFARPIEKEAYDRTESFRFTIDTRF